MRNIKRGILLGIGMALGAGIVQMVVSLLLLGLGLLFSLGGLAV